jgi:predicted AAA+ superfamily ATPase
MGRLYRPHLTTNLRGLAAEALRRLSGEKTEASTVFNMATQFGGGKTHTLPMTFAAHQQVLAETVPYWARR